MAKERICPNCGKKTRTTGDFCPWCSFPMVTNPDNSNPAEPETPENTNKINKGENDTMNNNNDNKNRNTIENSVLKVLGAIALIAFILFMAKSCSTIPLSGASATPKVTATPTVTAAPATTAAPAVAATTNPNIHIGLDYPMETWVLIKAGSVISADAAIWDGDNNNKKTPIYDGIEATADIIYFASDTYIWLEWGGHIIENASPEDIVRLINDKVATLVPGKTNTYTVRYFANFAKLGNNTFVTYTEKVTTTTIAK